MKRSTHLLLSTRRSDQSLSRKSTPLSETSSGMAQFYLFCGPTLGRVELVSKDFKQSSSRAIDRYKIIWNFNENNPLIRYEKSQETNCTQQKKGKKGNRWVIVGIFHPPEPSQVTLGPTCTNQKKATRISQVLRIGECIMNQIQRGALFGERYTRVWRCFVSQLSARWFISIFRPPRWTITSTLQVNSNPHRCQIYKYLQHFLKKIFNSNLFWKYSNSFEFNAKFIEIKILQKYLNFQ